MPRREKKSEPLGEEGSQAASPAASEEDRLIRFGMAMRFTWDRFGHSITRQHVDSVIEFGYPSDQVMETLSADLRSNMADLGKQDPRPFMERLKKSFQNLFALCQSQGEERLLEEMQSTLADLELVLTVRRYGGRRKGTRKKVTADVIENIRKWKHAGDRTWVSGSSVADVAQKLNVSRQTVYTILEEIKESEKENVQK